MHKKYKIVYSHEKFQISVFQLIDIKGQVEAAVENYLFCWLSEFDL